MTVGDRCQRCLEVGEGFDAVDLAGFDQRCNAAPGDAAFVVPGKEGLLAIDCDRADQVFDPVVVNLDTTIGQEGLQPVPVVMDVCELLAEPGLAGDFAALRLQPVAEGSDQRDAAGLAGRQSLARVDTTDIGLNGIEFGDAPQALGGDF